MLRAEAQASRAAATQQSSVVRFMLLIGNGVFGSIFGSIGIDELFCRCGRLFFWKARGDETSIGLFFGEALGEERATGGRACLEGAGERRR